MLFSRQTSRETARVTEDTGLLIVPNQSIVLKSQALKFKTINAFGKGGCSLGVWIYSLHISPSSSPSAQSLMKSHVCPSLTAVPFQQLKEPSRAIFEPEPDPREKENKNHFRLLNCLPLSQQVVGSWITLNGRTPCEIPLIQYLLDKVIILFDLFNLVKQLMVYLTENFSSPGISGVLTWKASLTLEKRVEILQPVLWYFSRTPQYA